jgi:hypothetical protein
MAIEYEDDRPPTIKILRGNHQKKTHLGRPFVMAPKPRPTDKKDKFPFPPPTPRDKDDKPPSTLIPARPWPHPVKRPAAKAAKVAEAPDAAPVARSPESPSPPKPGGLEAIRIHEKRKTSQQVKMMASTKVTHKAMAEMLGISVPQLKKEYANELSGGHEFVYAAVSLRLVNAAMGGEFRAMYSWLRQFGGWTDVSRREITGKNGEPISFKNLDDNSLVAILNALKTAGPTSRAPKGISSEVGIDFEGATDLDPIPGASDEGDA